MKDVDLILDFKFLHLLPGSFPRRTFSFRHDEWKLAGKAPCHNFYDRKVLLPGKLMRLE